MSLQVVKILLFAGGVDHQREFVAEILHHQIIQNAAFGVGQQAVFLAARGQGQNVRRNQRFQRRRRVVTRATANVDLPHVGYIEQPGEAAGVQVLGDDAVGVIDRHLIPGERHNFRAVFQMQGVHRGAL